MRVPLSWIREFVHIPESPEEVQAALEQLGIEVEATHVVGEGVSGIVVARVLDVRPHPNADRLRLVDIDDGTNQSTVVCGAPNVVKGMIAPLAPSGSVVAGGMKMERRKIRGEVSNGMLCSSRDLGIADDHAGIISLPESAEVGSDPSTSLGVGEVIFELSITPNRPDAMSVLGVARDLAAHFGRELCIPEGKVEQRVDGPTPTVDLQAEDACPRYVGWHATVENGPSPEWMARRLTACGIRPISAVVDVTNYVLLERNQPLHAFDFGAVGGGVIVRKAREGETLTTLDGKDRQLSVDDLLICDANDKPQALAGVMGGADSEIKETTTEILLEAAYFEPSGVAKSARRTGLRTEASSRFERGIDPNAVVAAAERAMELLQQVAGANVSRSPLDVYPTPIEERTVSVRPTRVNSVLGTDLSEEQIVGYLKPLGLSVVSGANALQVTVPTFRPDIEREIDVIEEVARHHGYQNIAPTMPVRSFHRGRLDPAQKARRVIADALTGNGYIEAKSFPLVAPEDLAAFGVEVDRQTTVANPLRTAESVITTTLLPGLLKSIAHNLRQSNNDLALFEMDKVFLDQGELLMDEHVNVAAVLCGQLDERPHAPRRPFDVYDLMRSVTDIETALALKNLRLQRTTKPGFRRGTCAEILVDDNVCGVVGEIQPDVAKHFEVNVPVFALELSTKVLASARLNDRQQNDVSIQPPVYFDLAFELSRDVDAADLVRTLVSANKELIESVTVFDRYEGARVKTGNVSLALSITLRASDRTLQDSDMGSVRKALINAARKRFGATVPGEAD